MAVTTTFSWTGGLNEFFNNGFTSGSQFAPAAASSFDRSEYLGAWGDPNGNFQVEARIQNSASQPVTDEFTVNTTTNTNFQFDPSVAGLTGGNFVVTYTDTNVDPGGDIRARIIGPSGGGAADFAVDVGGSDDSQSAVAELSGGGFVVTYTRNLGGGDLDIVARRFDSVGTPQGGLINVDVPGGAQTASQVAGLTSGGFVVVWEDAGVDEVYFRRFDASGVALGGRVLIDAFGTINTDIHVVALNDGGFAVAYTDNGWGISGTEITFQIFNADGSTRTPFIRANNAAFGGAEAGDQNLPTITTLGTNDLIVVGWRNAGEISFGQVFDTSGNPVGTNQTFNSAVLEHEFAGLSGGLMANVRASSFSEGTGLGNSIRTTVQEFTRSLTSDGASDTITGINDGLREILNGNGGDDILIGGTGNDALNGGAGSDTASYVTAAAGVTANLGNSALNTGDAAGDTYNSIENLTGSNFADTLFGDNSGNVVDGGAGDDAIRGGGGADALSGGDGNDVVFGDADDDNLGGNAGDDILIGGNGADTISGDDGDDSMAGEAGDDVMFGGAGNDGMSGGADNDTMVGQDGADLMNGNAGNDTMNGGSGADIMIGEIGNDTLGGGEDNDVLVGNEGDDFLFGEGGADQMAGGDGNDVMVGGANDDVMGGGIGNDVMLGDDGNDGIFGEDGDDTINTGAGNDVVLGGNGNDQIGGGSGNDSLFGEAGNDVIFGEDGNDFIIGGTGDDVIISGAGDDQIVVAAGDGSDVVTDFSAGGAEDRIVMQGTGIASFAGVLAAASEAGGNTTITYTGGSITFNGVALAQLTGADFAFI